MRDGILRSTSRFLFKKAGKSGMQEEYYGQLLSCLPGGVCRELTRFAADNADFGRQLSEIRLRGGKYAAITYGGRNLLLSYLVSPAEIGESFARLAAGSLYRYRESLVLGYFTVFGCRIGVGGRAVTEAGTVTGVGEITSLAIRIPHSVPGAGRVGEEVFSSLGRRRGLLVYSPPGVGKTTFLRDLAARLSLGPHAMRVAVIDARGELYDAELPPAAGIDYLFGYPLAAGIEVATRTLSPEVIFCDEIGSYEEAESILSVAGGGVPIIASAHAGDMKELLSRQPIRLLHELSVFGAYVGISRTETGYRYTVDREGTRTPLEEECVPAEEEKETSGVPCASECAPLSV